MRQIMENVPSKVWLEALPILHRVLDLLEFPGHPFDDLGVLGGNVVGF